MSEKSEYLLRKVAYQSFLGAMKEKEEKRRKEHPERPMLPWAKYTRDELMEWLLVEVDELKEAIESGNEEAISSELCDVANFCEFMWSVINFLPIVPGCLLEEKIIKNGHREPG